jgi:hypothetical protein
MLCITLTISPTLDYRAVKPRARCERQTELCPGKIRCYGRDSTSNFFGARKRHYSFFHPRCAMCAGTGGVCFSRSIIRSASH